MKSVNEFLGSITLFKIRSTAKKSFYILCLSIT